MSWILYGGLLLSVAVAAVQAVVPEPMWVFPFDTSLADVSGSIAFNPVQLNSSGAAAATKYATDRCGLADGAWSPPSNTYLSTLTSVSLPTGSSPRSFFMWLQCVPNALSMSMLFWGSVTTGANSLHLQTLSKSLSFYTTEPSAPLTAPLGPPSPCDGQWHHIGVVYDGSNVLTLYMDGVALASGAMGVLGTVPSPLSLGAIPTWDASSYSQLFQGSVDDLRIWKLSLNASQVAQLYLKQSVCPVSSFLVRQTAYMYSDPAVQQGGQLAVVFQGKLWVGFGGPNAANNDPSRRNSLQVGFSADMGQTWTWSLASPAAAFQVPGSSTRVFPVASSAATYNNMIVVAGGTTANVAVFNYLWYSLDGVTWSMVSGNPWVGRVYASLVAVQLPTPRLYLFAGTSNTATPCHDMWYTTNPTTAGGWQQQPGQTPFANHLNVYTPTAVTDSNRIVVYADTLWISNVGVTQWSEVLPSTTSWPGSRTLSSLLNVAGNLVLVGGQPASQGTLLNDVWISSDEGSSWALLTAQAPFSARTQPTTVAMGKFMFVLGTLQTVPSSTVSTDVWIGRL